MGIEYMYITYMEEVLKKSHWGGIIFAIVLIAIALLLWSVSKNQSQNNNDNNSDVYMQAASIPAENQGVVTEEERAAIEEARLAPAE